MKLEDLYDLCVRLNKFNAKHSTERTARVAAQLNEHYISCHNDPEKPIESLVTTAAMCIVANMGRWNETI